MKITIHRLELLASVILSRLIATAKRALKSVIQIEDYCCWTDSKTAYYWIKNGKEHKQFVQNRVDEVLQNSDPDKWFHVLGIDNPADIGTRGHYFRRLKIMTFAGMGLAGYNSPRTAGLPNCHLLLRLQRKENLN